MSNVTTDQNVNEEVIGELVRQTTKDHLAVEDSQTEYVPVFVSASASRDAKGASMQGWITYVNGPKIFFKKTKITESEGLIAAVGALPLFARRPELLAGKTGDFQVKGFAPIGVLQMWVGGKPVLSPHLVIGGAGIGKFLIKGDVSFTLHK